MKKIHLIILLCLILTGCSTSGIYHPFALADERIVLVDDASEIIDPNGYDSCIEVSSIGYIVTNVEKYGFITKRGDMTIEFGAYDYLKSYGSLIVGLKEELVEILDATGKVIHTNKKSDININNGLPVIFDNDKYIVYDSNFTILSESSNEVISAFNYNDTHYIVNYKDESILHYTNGIQENQTIDLGGYFEILKYTTEGGYFLVDKINGELAKVLDGELLFVNEINHFEDMENGFEIKFIDDENFTVTYDSTIDLYTIEGDFVNTVNSFYKDANNYVLTNSSFIYGPHVFYKDGKEFEITGVQMDPFAGYSYGEIIPVFVNGESYTYYNYDGTQAMEQFFDKVDAFDYNERAIVSLKNDVYLIDLEGNFVTEAYKNIELFGEEYYLAYLTDSQFIVLNKNGEQVIENVFMGYSKLIISEGMVYSVLTKSGKTFVYNMEDYSVVFEQIGISSVYNKYLLIDDTYYTLIGKKVWTR